MVHGSAADNSAGALRGCVGMVLSAVGARAVRGVSCVMDAAAACSSVSLRFRDARDGETKE
eukprot:gene8722-45176_t